MHSLENWMRHCSLCVFILGICFWPAWAAGKPAPAATDAAAIVGALERHYNSQSAWKATFLERRSEGKRAVEIESGTAYFQKPRRMRWEYESPEQKLFLTDGKYAWFFVPADHTVSRAKMNESDDDRVPLALLTGQAKLSRLCKRVERSATPALQEGNTALRCLPRTEGAFVDAVIEVDSSYRLARIIVREAGDVETEFRFANWEENLHLPETLFHFLAPAGVAIVEDPSLNSANR